MPDVVSDTTPIICLLKIGRLDVLRTLYGEVAIPLAVFHEVEQGKGKRFYQNLSTLDWIKVTPVVDRGNLSNLVGLDAGEAEAIALALETNARLIILDERMGRQRAKEHGLKVTGTLGVLLKAKSEGIVDRVAPLITELMQKDVWLNERLVREILKKAGE
jgi:predicted nucleic acid-binding protein